MLAFQEKFEDVRANIESFVKGKSDVVGLALTCFFAGGHLLIEDVPGVAKTSLAKAIATSMKDGTFGRVQFTPDLMPSDVTGVDVFNQSTGTFSFRPGPVFANVVLADEINRAAPRTQSALLQVMAERQVTVGLETHDVPQPFFCVATQNPVDHQGTYLLPEAQLDRFLMRVSVGYPHPTDEMEVISQGVSGRQVEDVAGVVTREEVAWMRSSVRQVQVSDALTSYIVGIASRTRSMSEVRLGVSPRGSIALAVAAQARAATCGRSYATPGDVKAVAGPVLGHRLVLSQEARIQGKTPNEVVDDVLRTVDVPRRP